MCGIFGLLEILVLVIATIAVFIFGNAFVVIGIRLAIEKLCGQAWKSWVVRCTADAGLAGFYTLMAGTFCSMCQFNDVIETLVQTNFTGPYLQCQWPYHSYETARALATDIAHSDTVNYLRWMTAIHWFGEHIFIFVIAPMIIAYIIFHFVDTCGAARAKKPAEI